MTVRGSSSGDGFASAFGQRRGVHGPSPRDCNVRYQLRLQNTGSAYRFDFIPADHPSNDSDEPLVRMFWADVMIQEHTARWWLEVMEEHQSRTFVELGYSGELTSADAGQLYDWLDSRAPYGPLAPPATQP